MNSEKLKTLIGNNIAAFRRQCGMTQAELAEKLNYSDKAVSKWERGESVPDVITLMHIAALFGVEISDITGKTEVLLTPKTEPQPVRRKGNKNVIQMLVSLLVWFVALSVYVVLSSLDVPRSWLGFAYAVPANAIVLLCLRSAWRKFNWNVVLVSVIVWGCLIGFHLSMLIFTGFNIWRLFLLGILGQAAVLLWFRLFHGTKEEKNG